MESESELYRSELDYKIEDKHKKILINMKSYPAFVMGNRYQKRSDTEQILSN